MQNVTTYDYNQRNELILETNQLGKSRVFDYDKVGNLATKTDRNNRTIKFEYDELDRLLNEQWKDAANSTVRTFTYDYDAASRLTSAIDPDSSYTYSYDQADRLTQVSNAGTADVPTVLFNYGYDAVNYLVSIQDTTAGQVRGTSTLTRDRLNRLKEIRQSGTGVTEKRVDMRYDAASQIKGISRYRDLAGTQMVADSEYNYDLAGRLQDLTHRKANNTTIANYGLTYDPGDRLTQITSIDGPTTFSYDTANQLTSADHASQTDENYGYDLNGNRINAGYQTGGNNQLLTDGTYNYAYDDEGNRTSRTTIGTGAVTEYAWDYRNRLPQVAEKSATGVVTRLVNYRYDVNNHRIAKIVDLDGVGTQVATTERYVYDGDHIALVFDGQGNQLQRFLYGIEVDQVLVQENANGDLLWALADYQGSVRDVIDSQGNLLNHIVYDSFGNVTSQTNSAVNFRFGYTGRELDSETGLYYYRSRYYDPHSGQFIGQDSLGFAAGDSNLYRYVSNSPTNFTDPSGHYFLPSVRDVADLSDSMNPLGRLGIRPANWILDRIRDSMEPCDAVEFENDIRKRREIDLGERFGEEAVDWYGERLYDQNTPFWQKPALGLGLGLSGLWTRGTSNATVDTLSAALTANGALKSAGLSTNIKSPWGPNCFIAGTLILTRDGKKPIEDLTTGDWVVSWDEEQGELIERPVTEWFRREAPAIIDIFIGVEKISCTIDHPFWVEKTGWVLASQIKPGTVLRDRTGNLLTVDEVRRRYEVTPVYNVEIQGLHTYFVSNLEVLSHNMCGGTVNPINFSSSITKFDPKFAANQVVKNGRTHVDDLTKLVPNGIDDIFVPGDRIAKGSKFKYEVNGQKVEVKWHSPDTGAPIGSNSANGWTAQIKIKNKLLGQDGKLYRKPSNLTHIPVDF